MIFKPIRLDVDLFSDRTREGSVSHTVLKLPEEDIFMASSSEFVIVNYNPETQYDIHFSHGTFSRDGATITYESDSEHVGDVVLTIKASSGDGEGYVLLPDGTRYNDAGDISKGGLDSYPSEVVSAAPIVPPVPTNRDGGITSGEIGLQGYDITKLFGDLGGRALSKASRIGNVADYSLPSESSKERDHSPGLYQVSVGRFTAVPRNSNVTWSGGNIFDGYGDVGGVGGSLRVKKGVLIAEVVDRWVFSVMNNDLSAVMPPDVMSLCLSSVSFSPLLVGNSKGHTFWWELIAGDDTSVSWETPRNQVNVTINLGSTRVDRTFRFWISKGTKYEKYYDINIYSTPREETSIINERDVFRRLGEQTLLMTHTTTPLLLWYHNVWDRELRLRVRQ